MADSYLTKDFGSAGNRKTMTFSFRVKRNNLGTGGDTQELFIGDAQSSYPSHFIDFDSANKLDIRSQDGVSGATLRFISNREFIDTTSWYHIVVAIDTTQASAGDRCKAWANGEQITSWGTSTQSNGFGQNSDTNFNSGASTEYIGKHYNHYSNFNLAHYHFVDGTALTPSTFGETDSTTGEWKPKLNPSVTYGTHGFFLKFENSGALGTDSSGNSKTWTVNGNLKQSVNTPSNVFCTLDTNQAYVPASVDYAGTAYLGTSASADGCASTQMVKNGKWYFEVKLGTDRTTSDSATISIAKNGTHAQRRWRNSGGANAIVGKETGSNGCEGITYQPLTSTPNIIDDGGGGTVNYGSQASENDIIMVAVDLSAATSKIWFGKNGTWFNAPSTSSAGDPANGNYAGLSFAKGDDFWGINITAVTNQANNANKYMYCNFGEGRFGATAIASANADGNSVGAFEYAVPSGFYAICTKNIKSYG